MINHTCNENGCQICNQDYLEQFKKLSGDIFAQQPCPSCGYCPTCGRSRTPWQQPYYWQQPITTWISDGTGLQVPQAPNS